MKATHWFYSSSFAVRPIFVESALAMLLEHFIALRLETERMPEMSVWAEPQNETDYL